MADKNLRLQVILEGLDRITTPLKSITGASSAARRDLAKTGEELKRLEIEKRKAELKAMQAGSQSSNAQLLADLIARLPG